jgi:NAD(P)-dependent dehydrogenase (short-subunit alcohol dehydrogenase family)
MTDGRRTALVTGANRGIGLAVARGLAAQGGIRVLAAARTANEAETAAGAIGSGATGVTLELSDPAKAGKRALDIESEHGPIDILVNNAGILVSGDVLSVSPEDFLKSLQVNVASPFALINALGARMKRRGWGRIVNMSSGLGSFHEGLEGPAAYSVSKAALNAITVSAARTLGPAVKVNAACPGWVCTRMGGENAPRSPEEGADTPVWLARLPDDGPTGKFFRNRNSICW